MNRIQSETQDNHLPNCEWKLRMEAARLSAGGLGAQAQDVQQLECGKSY